MPHPSRHPLVESSTRIIERYRNTADKELIESLVALRDELERSLSEGRKRDAARTSLQIASWVKFFYDLWGDM